jgi:glycosyltransferase involved in cell wall biosynthesis
VSRIVVIGGLAESLTNFRGELLKKLLSAGHMVIAMAGDENPVVIDQLAAMRVSFEPYPMQRNGLNPAQDARTFLALRETLRRLHPDVVLAYTIKPVIWAGLALRSVPGPRFCALITGLGYGLHGGSLTRRALSFGLTRLYRAALARASVVIFQNPDDLSAFQSRGIVPRDRCAIVDGSGVDVAHFQAQPLPEGPPVFLAIGRLLGEKGFREYSAAAALVKRRYPEAAFRLLGPPDSSPDGIPLSEVEAWQRDGRIQYLGAASDVRPFIRDCHVFVLPSYHEGMPRSVLEAMAMARPVVTTDVPGCRETVSDGVNGYVLPARDSRALANALIALIERRDTWPDLAARSRQIAERRFDVNLVNNRMLFLMGLAS